MLRLTNLAIDHVASEVLTNIVSGDTIAVMHKSGDRVICFMQVCECLKECRASSSRPPKNNFRRTETSECIRNRKEYTYEAFRLARRHPRSL